MISLGAWGAWRDIVRAVRDFPFWRDLGEAAPEPPAAPGRRQDSWRRMAPYLWRQWPLIALLLLLIVVSSALGVLPALIVRQIVDVGIKGHHAAALTHGVLRLVGVELAQSLVAAGATTAGALASNDIVARMRRNVVDAVRRAESRSVREVGGDTLVTRAINDVGIVGGQSSVFSGVIGLFTTAVSVVQAASHLVATVVALLLLAPGYGVLLIGLALPFLLLTRLAARWMYWLTRRQYEVIGEMNGLLRGQAAAGARGDGGRGDGSWGGGVRDGGPLDDVPRDEGTRDGGPRGEVADADGRFARVNRRLADLGTAVRTLSRDYGNVWGLIPGIGVALIWWFGGRQVMGHTLQIGTVLALVAYVTRLDVPINTLATTFISLRSIGALFDRLGHALALGEGAGAPAPRWLWWLRRDAPQHPEVPRTLDWTGRAAAGEGGRPFFRVVLRFFFPYWPYWAWQLFSVTITGAVVATAGPLFLRMVVNRALPQHSTHLLLIGVLGMLAVPVVHQLANLTTACHELMSNRALRDLRLAAFRRWCASGVGRGTESATRLLNDVNALYVSTATIADATFMLWPLLPKIGVMLVLDWRLGWIVLALMVPYVPLTRWCGRLSYALTRRIYEAVSDTYHTLERIVQAAAAGQAVAPDEVARFAADNAALARLGLTDTLVRAYYLTCFSWKAVAVRALFWWLGGLAALAGHLSLGTLLAMQAYAGVVDNFGGVFGMYLSFRSMQANGDRLADLLPAGPPARGPAVGATFGA